MSDPPFIRRSPRLANQDDSSDSPPPSPTKSRLRPASKDQPEKEKEEAEEKNEGKNSPKIKSKQQPKTSTKKTTTSKKKKANTDDELGFASPELHTMKRKELQIIAKKIGMPANSKNQVLIDNLKDYVSSGKMTEYNILKRSRSGRDPWDDPKPAKLRKVVVSPPQAVLKIKRVPTPYNQSTNENEDKRNGKNDNKKEEKENDKVDSENSNEDDSPEKAKKTTKPIKRGRRKKTKN